MAVDIRKLRQDIRDSGMTQVAIANAAGYHKSVVSLLMRGRSDDHGPSLHAIRAVADVLGFSMRRYTRKSRRAAK